MSMVDVTSSFYQPDRKYSWVELWFLARLRAPLGEADPFARAEILGAGSRLLDAKLRNPTSRQQRPLQQGTRYASRWDSFWIAPSVFGTVSCMQILTRDRSARRHCDLPLVEVARLASSMCARTAFSVCRRDVEIEARETRRTIGSASHRSEAETSRLSPIASNSK
jgi:hypothetical protein